MSAESIATSSHAAPEGGIHIALAAEKIGTFFGIPITNTLITSWVVMALLIGIAVLMGPRLTLIPGKLQTLFEVGYEFILKFITDTLENEKLARKFFPYLVTLFLFIFVSNLIEFTPGIGSIGFFGPEGFIPLFRSVNTDLNVTLALTVIAVLTIEIMGVVTLGLLKYGSKFFNFSSPLGFVVGLIELVSELARLISFSFRLFGNIFAGEVLIGVAVFFAPYIMPVPLMAFELFVGLVQAAIFTLLTLFFIKLAITPLEAH